MTESFDLIGTDLGPLAAALAKAQAQFPAITRDKKVTITTKTGGSYSFNYAPLDVILASVRKPLTDNGLALVQLLDGEALVTMLIHETGGTISGRMPLARPADIKEFGSAITYLRRYAIQALLGIAAEEDDDGSAAVGDHIAPRRPEPKVEQTDDGGLIGEVQVGDKASSDFLVRQSPEGSALGFRLRGGRGGILVECRGPLADQLFAVKDAIVGKRVTVWGAVSDRSFTPKGKPEVTYQVLAAHRLHAPDIGTLPKDATPDVDGAPEPSGAAPGDAAMNLELEALEW